MLSTPSPVLTLLLVLCLGAILRADEPAPYEQKLAAAEGFISEHQWSQARSAFMEAASLAPDDTTRRWCEIWQDVLPKKNDAYWSPPEASRQPLILHLDNQLAPYAAGKARDEYWRLCKSLHTEIISLQESSTGWEYDGMGKMHWHSSSEKTESRASWDALLEVADYLANDTTSPESADRYIQHLRRIVTRLGVLNLSAAGDRMRSHIARARELKASPDNNAWCLFAYARCWGEDARLSLQERDENWTRAVHAAKGTPWQEKTRAACLIWQIRRCLDPDHRPTESLDLPTALAELRAMQKLQTSHDEEILPGDPQSIHEIVRHLSIAWMEKKVSELYEPNQPVSFDYASLNLVSLRATLYRTSDTSSASSTRPPAGAQPSEMIRQWDIPLQDTRPGSWCRATEQIAPSLPPGSYLLSLHCTARKELSPDTSEFVQEAGFLVSSLAATVFNDDLGGSEIFLQDRHTGQPFANQPVQVLNDPDTPSFETSILPPTQTDAHGRARFRTVSGNTTSPFHKRELLTGLMAGGEPLVYSRELLSPEPTLQFDLYAEKVDCLPGDKLNWRLHALNYRDHRFQSPDTPLYLTAYLNGDTVLKAEPLEFHSTRAATGHILIPVHAQPGEVVFWLHREPNLALNSRAWKLAAIRVNMPANPTLAGAVINHTLGAAVLPVLKPTAPLHQNAPGVRLQNDPLAMLSLHRPPSSGLSEEFGLREPNPNPALIPPGSTWIHEVAMVEKLGAKSTFHGEARLMELRWRESTANPSEGKYEYTLVSTQAARHNRQGNIKTRFKLPQPGLFEIQYWQQDTRVLVSPQGPTALALPPTGAPTTLAPSASYLFGPDKIISGNSYTVTALLPDNAARCWLTVLGEKAARTRPIEATGRIASITVESAEEIGAHGALLLWAESDLDQPIAGLPLPLSKFKLPDEVFALVREVEKIPGRIAGTFTETWYLERDQPGYESPEDFPYEAAERFVITRWQTWRVGRGMYRFLSESEQAQQKYARYLAMAGRFYWPVSVEAASVQTKSGTGLRDEIPDPRRTWIFPIQTDPTKGYCPEPFSRWSLSPFN